MAHTHSSIGGRCQIFPDVWAPIWKLFWWNSMGVYRQESDTIVYTGYQKSIHFKTERNGNIT